MKPFQRLVAAAFILMIARFGCAHATQPQAGLPILVYHQIRSGADGPPDSLEAISLEAFEAQMRKLAEAGYRTLDADEVVAFVEGGLRPAGKVVAIHFDDGWASARLALPALRRHGLKATFWIIAGTGIGAPHMEWDDVLAIDADPLFDVQSHSMSHPWKDGDTLLDWMGGRTPGRGEADVVRELGESRRVLAGRLGRPVRHLAWPRGLHDGTLARIAREQGYDALFTIDDGVNLPGDDPSRIRRTMVHGGCDAAEFARILEDGRYRDCAAPGARAQSPTRPLTEPSRFAVDASADRLSTGAWSADLNLTAAPIGPLGESGPRLRAALSRSCYRYRGGADGDPLASGCTSETGLLAGWGLVFPRTVVLALAGPTATSSTDAGIRGRTEGMRAVASFYSRPSERTMAYGMLAHSTILTSTQLLLKAGVAIPGGMFVGPEFHARWQGARPTEAPIAIRRLGLHLSGIRVGRWSLSLSAGMARDRELGNAGYVGVGLYGPI